MKSKRAAGILLHPTSLPGPYGVGDLGDEALRFIDFLVAARQGVWQVLPLGPTGYGDSPYSAFSAFAGNPLLISPERLVAVGDALPEEIACCTPCPEGQADYGFASAFKSRLIQAAARRFAQSGSPQRRTAFAAFCAEQSGWLEDYALFRALRARFGHRRWAEWPVAVRDREPAALAAAGVELAEALHVERYTQFVFYEQWFLLKGYAQERGVRLFGDLPIFVADDSADVWAHRELFCVDSQGQPRKVAGVPPDYFSATGQRWGNPLYDWDQHMAGGFRWWIDRLRHNFALCDLVRIDHFRGFDACWAIPAAEPTAVNGRWEKAPGVELFQAAAAALGHLPVVAEDLGIITPEVEALRDRFGFPGMKILHFAFGSGADNPYLPHNYGHDCVVYTGTHDNDTTAGWWEKLSDNDRRAVMHYLGSEAVAPCRDLVRLAAASVARLCVVPLQDALELGSEARFNTPGAPHGNWGWRLASPAPLAAAQFLAELAETYGRLPHPASR